MVVHAGLPLLVVTGPAAGVAAWLLSRLGFEQLAWSTLALPPLGLASMWLHETGHAAVASLWTNVQFESGPGRLSTVHVALDARRNACVALAGPLLPAALGAIWFVMAQGPMRLGSVVLLAHLAALAPPSRDHHNLRAAVRKSREREDTNDLAP